VVPVTVALNCRLCPGNRFAVDGERVTAIAPTFTITADDVIAPGSGFATVTWTDTPFCDVVAVPVAVNSVAETNFVVRVCPPNITLAPLTNLVPVIVREKFPTGTAVGETAVTVGIGFSSEIALLPERDLLDAEVASIVTELGVGRAAGEVYRPLVLILPTVALPPTVPFTDQATDWSMTPLIFAENWSVSPARTLALAGETSTAEEGVLELEPPKPAQPESKESPSRRHRVLTTRVECDCAILGISDPLSKRPKSELFVLGAD
jgi:hypothetical protein